MSVMMVTDLLLIFLLVDRAIAQNWPTQNNVASSLQALSREFTVPVVASAFTHEAAKACFDWLAAGEVTLRGKSQTLSLYVPRAQGSAGTHTPMIPLRIVPSRAAVAETVPKTEVGAEAARSLASGKS